MPKIKLVPLIIGHLFFGVGIFYIGYVIKNKIEMLLGLLVPVVVVLINFFPTALPYSLELTAFGVVLYILSWVYILIRLLSIKKNKICEITFLPSRK